MCLPIKGLARAAVWGKQALTEKEVQGGETVRRRGAARRQRNLIFSEIESVEHFMRNPQDGFLQGANTMTVLEIDLPSSIMTGSSCSLFRDFR
jgi:hypothetical protein